MRYFLFVLALAVAMLAPAAEALAQATRTGPGARPEILNAIPPNSDYPPPPPTTHLLKGEIGDLRSSLKKKGIDILLDDWSEFAGNLSGGTRKAQVFAGQIALEVDLD